MGQGVSRGLRLMRCVSITVVKNEADVIEAMVRHNVQFLDQMTIIDNGSTDGTAEILAALHDEGLPLTIRHDPALGHIQTALVNDFVNGPDRDPAAYVFLLDGDEFLCADLAAFNTFLATRPPSFALAWKTYVPTRLDKLRDVNVLTRITHARRREPPRQAFVKAVISPDEAAPLRVSAGNHGLRGRTLLPCPDIRLAHFPVRSVQQLACKALLGAWNVQLRGRGRSEAAQWFDLADRIRQTGLPSRADLQAIGASYAADRPMRLVADPLVSPVPVELRYAALAKDPLLSGLVDFVDRLVARAHDPVGTRDDKS